MDFPEILTAADITRPRAPTAFYAWVARKNEELSTTADTKRYARFGAELSKKFRDEIYPLALFVAREFADVKDALVIPSLNNDNFDATVCFADGRPDVFIEITQAKDGYDESLRMEVASRDGIVSLTGPITRISGRRGAPDRLVNVHHEMVAHDGLLARHVALVESAVMRKANRSYGKNCILLVVVDDYLPFRDESDHAKLNNVVTSKLLLPDLDFMRLIIFGISGKLLLSYQLPKYSHDKAT